MYILLDQVTSFLYDSINLFLGLVKLAFISFLLSVSLWFSGYKLEGIFVGIWVPSILSFSIAIRQRRRDSKKK